MAGFYGPPLFTVNETTPLHHERLLLLTPSPASCRTSLPVDWKDLLRRKRDELRSSRNVRPLADLRVKARSAPPLQDLRSALRRNGEAAVIAPFLPPPPPSPELPLEEIADACRDAGVHALLVTTDGLLFGGSPEIFRSVRRRAGLPILRHDFIVEEYQLWETRVLLADGVLFHPPLMEPQRLSDAVSLAREDLRLVTMAVVEEPEHLESALDAHTDFLLLSGLARPERAEHYWKILPRSTDVIAADGATTPAAFQSLTSLGVRGILLPPALMSSQDLRSDLARLRGVAPSPRPLVIVQREALP